MQVVRQVFNLEWRIGVESRGIYQADWFKFTELVNSGYTNEIPDKVIAELTALFYNI